MTASIRELKAKASELVATAKRGEEVIITSNGQPCAKLVPINPVHKATFDWAKMRRLAKKGATGKRGPDSTQIISDLREDRF